MVWEEIRRILAGAEEASRKGGGSRGRGDQEVASELGTVAADPPVQLSEGVRVEPAHLRQGQAFTVTYQGILAQRGATGVTMHCGYGTGDWSDVKDIPMTPRGFQVWQATVIAEKPGPFNFCFRDAAGNWDNHYGNNWSVNIEA